MSGIQQNLEKIKPKNSGGLLFLELAFRAIDKEIYTDFAYAKQNSTILGNELRKEVKKYLGTLLSKIGYEIADVKKFEDTVKDSLANNSNRKEMMEIFMPIARDIAKKRTKRSIAFWE